jgi:hypothetical protein
MGSARWKPTDHDAWIAYPWISPGSHKNSSAATAITATSIQPGEHSQSVLRLSIGPGNGGWFFAIAPDTQADRAPAAWLASAHPATIVLTPSPSSSSTIGRADLLARVEILFNGETEDGRYLILAAADGVHRLLLPATCTADTLSYLVHGDLHMGLRIAAIRRFQTFLAGGVASRETRRDVPSRHQRARLETMLRILDALDSVGGARPSLRDIAGTILYPGQNFPRAIEWKSSSERRQASRMVHEAIMMRDRSYRTLLEAKNSQA